MRYVVKTFKYFCYYSALFFIALICLILNEEKFLNDSIFNTISFIVISPIATIQTVLDNLISGGSRDSYIILLILFYCYILSRSNKVQKIILLGSVLSFMLAMMIIPPIIPYMETVSMNGSEQRWYRAADSYAYEINKVQNLKILIVFLIGTISLCYLARKKKTQDNNISTSISSAWIN